MLAATRLGRLRGGLPSRAEAGPTWKSLARRTPLPDHDEYLTGADIRLFTRFPERASIRCHGCFRSATCGASKTQESQLVLSCATPGIGRGSGLPDISGAPTTPATAAINPTRVVTAGPDLARTSDRNNPGKGIWEKNELRHSGHN